MKTQSEGTTSAQRIQTERAIEREVERALDLQIKHQNLLGELA